MRTCPKCNLIIDNDSAKFCRKCGTKLPDIQPIESSEPEIIAEPEQEFHQAQDYSNAIIEPQTDEYNELEAQSDSQSDSISFDVETTNEPVHEESLDQPEIVNISPVEDINNNLAEEQNYISVEPTNDQPVEESNNNLEEEQNCISVEPTNDQPAEVGAPIDTTEQNVEVSQYTPPTIDYAKAWKIIIASSIAILLGLVLWMLELSI
jgi:hypothetical protein